ncbi:MAG TPA: glycosyltransferase family A protein [Propionibacteriaceae bacterium]
MPEDGLNGRPNATQHVRIAVLTYQRPRDLEDILPMLVEQARSVTHSKTFVDIVVVDNDPAASARKLVVGFAQSVLDLPVLYEHEPEPGIAAARNRALDTAGEADLLVFIDDDERPSQPWLSLMLSTYDKHASAAVVGPVISAFAVEPDPWITAGKFFVRLRRPTGTPVKVAATNNLLLDLHQVRRMNLKFDVHFGISGGSDTLFTRALHEGGGRLVWCDEAVVTDVVPPSRINRSWVLKRALRSGNAASTTSLRLARSRAHRVPLRLTLAARGATRIAGGSTQFLVGAVSRSQAHRARGARTCARGIGMLSGAWGYSYQEYKRT